METFLQLVSQDNLLASNQAGRQAGEHCVSKQTLSWKLNFPGQTKHGV